MVLTGSDLTRAVLLVRRDNALFVESIGICPEGAEQGIDVVNVATSLDKLRQLPRDDIEATFSEGQARLLSGDYLASLAADRYTPGITTAHIVPVLENGQAIACFYLEGPLDEAAMQAFVDEGETRWAFSGMLARQVINMWAQEEQTEQFQIAQQALWASEVYLKAILHHAPALISVKDLDGNVVLASDAYKKLADIGDDGFVGKKVFDVYSEDVAKALWQLDEGLIASDSEHPVESELQIKHEDGSLHTYLMVKFCLRDKSGKTFGVCSICTDISERKQAEDALREQQSRLNHMAYHDTLTNLPNRALFYDRIGHGLARASRGRSKLAVLLLDLDRFKIVNDSLGHDAGDILLKTIGNRLISGVREMDTVARLGGDEFVVILEGIESRDEVEMVSEKLLTSLAEPLQVCGHEIATTASIGISMYPDDGAAADELLKHSDLAMYKAKRMGANTYQFYTDCMSSTAVNFLLLENDLRRAIELEQMKVYYQPQMDAKTGQLVGFEALVRWLHPTRGIVSPVQFIPLAEETGLIVPLGEAVLRQACRQQKQWLDEGKAVGRVAVNISVRQFRQKNFPDIVAKILLETELPARYLELEVTETSAMEHAGATINQLHELNRMGISLAIDDFGTGYSSLSYLKRFPIHKLKIDRSFVRDIHTDASDAAIAKSIIGLAHNMGLRVVAEGVEVNEQSEWLRDEQCDELQGYLFSAPVPPEQLEGFFRAGQFSADNNVVQFSA